MSDRSHDAHDHEGRQVASKPRRIFFGLAPTAATVALMIGATGAAVATSPKTDAVAFEKSTSAVTSGAPAATAFATMPALHLDRADQAKGAARAKDIRRANHVKTTARANHLAAVARANYLKAARTSHLKAVARANHLAAVANANHRAAVARANHLAAVARDNRLAALARDDRLAAVRRANYLAAAASDNRRAAASNEATDRANSVARSTARKSLASPAAEPTSSGQETTGWQLPISNPVKTSGFGYRWGRLHAGEDFAVSEGTPLASMSTGTVAFAGQEGGYGNIVKIRYSDGTVSYYGHMSSISVSAGQSVTRGEIVGQSGNTGHSTGPHLHLEIHPGGGAAIDPLPWLASHNIAP